MKNYKTKLILNFLIFIFLVTLVPFNIVKAEEISGECFKLENTTSGDKGTMPIINDSTFDVETFNFNGSTSGDKGTVPVFNRSTFIKDKSEEYVLDAGVRNRIIYDLGISSSGGKMGILFKAHNKDKYLIASSDDEDNAVLNMYINKEGKLELAVRGNDTIWEVVVTSSEIVKLDEWNYASMKWTLSGSTLNCTLSLNDNEYKGSTCDFIDFTGIKTGIACYPQRNYDIPLLGLVRYFTYCEVYTTNERKKGDIPLEKTDWNPFSNTWKGVIEKIKYRYGVD